MLDDDFWPPAEAFLDLSSMSQLTDGHARCTGVAVCDEEGRATRTFQQGQWAHFFYEFEVLKGIGVPMAALECQDEGGRVFQAPSIIRNRRDARERRMLGSVLPGTGLYYHHIIHLRVGPGKYFFTVRLSLPDSVEYCRAVHAGSFTVIRENEQVAQTAWSTTDQRPQPAPQLESRGQVLLAQLEEKQQVIYDLNATAEERLELINRLKEEMNSLRAQLEEKQHPEEDVVWRRHTNYQKIIQQIRGVVSTTLPLAATVIVVSKGDDALLQLDGRIGWHFPQGADGLYAGHHPADSTEAIAHLEVLRAQGGGFLLLPDTAFWWLDYYRELHQHLDANYRRIWSDEYCIIYQLSALYER